MPVYEILKSGARSSPSTMFNPTVGLTSFPFKADKGNAYNARPYVVLSNSAKSSPNGGCTICLMATFSHAGRLEDVPEVLQKFCVPVIPHDLCKIHPELTHIHTTPEWQMWNTWIIAYGYTTYGRITGRWEDRAPSSPTGSSFKLDAEMRMLLTNICMQRRIQWEALSAQDTSLAKRCYQQYKTRITYGPDKDCVIADVGIKGVSPAPVQTTARTREQQSPGACRSRHRRFLASRLTRRRCRSKQDTEETRNILARLDPPMWHRRRILEPQQVYDTLHLSTLTKMLLW